MGNVRNQINERCPECSQYENVPFSFTGEVDEVVNESLYKCDGCSALVWVNSSEVKEK